MAYDLDWSTSETANQLPGKTHIIIQPNTTDTTSTSLKLFGKGASNYGEGQQENFLKLLENFASYTEPANATVGQLFWKIFPAGDPRVPMMLVCNAPNSWVPISEPRIRIAYNSEYNQLVDKFHYIVGDVVVGGNDESSRGWGQATLTNSVSKLYVPANPVTNADWDFLLNKWKQIAPLVGVDPAVFNSSGFILQDHMHVGDNIPEGTGVGQSIMEYQSVVNGAQKVFENRFKFIPSALEVQSLSAPLVAADYSNRETIIDLRFQWSSADQMFKFFNAGGRLSIIPSLSSPGNDSTTFMWREYLDMYRDGISISAEKTDDNLGIPGRFSANRSIFELPDKTDAWPANAGANTHGYVLYNSWQYDVLGPAGYVVGYNDYYDITYDGTRVLKTPPGTSNMFNNRVFGYIIIEAKKQTAINRLEVRVSFVNGRTEGISGFLTCAVSAIRAAASSVITQPPEFPVLVPGSVYVNVL